MSDEIKNALARDYETVAGLLNVPVEKAVNLNPKKVQDFKELVYDELRKADSFLAKIPSLSQMDVKLRELCGQKGVPSAYQDKVIEGILDDIFNYGPMTPLMKMEGVTTIRFEGDIAIWYKQFGEWKKHNDRFHSLKEVHKFIERKLKATPYRWSPFDSAVDAILKDGSRLHVKGATAGVTVDNGDGRAVYMCPIGHIRRFLYPFTLTQLRERGSFDERMRAYLQLLPTVGDSFLVIGAQEVGKTTLLNAMTAFILEGKAVYILEEMTEVQPQCYAIRLWNRTDNGDNAGAIGMEDNVVELVRMTSDVTIFGEIRRPKIAYEFLRVLDIAMFFVAATLHANDAEAAIRRIVSLARSAKEKPDPASIHADIADGIGHLLLLKRRGAKVGMAEIVEVDGVDEFDKVKLRKVFDFDIDSGRSHYYGISDRLLQKAVDAGVNVPEILLKR
jgi:pilus assembly protein CpaF